MKYSIFLIIIITFILLGTVIKFDNKLDIAHQITAKAELSSIESTIGNLENWRKWLVWADYPYPEFTVEKNSNGIIQSQRNNLVYRLYLSTVGTGYILSFNSEPVSLSGYCNIGITGEQLEKSITLNCSQQSIDSDHTLAPPLPVDLPASLEKLKLLLVSN